MLLFNKKNNKKLIVAMIHFPPLVGFSGYHGIENIRKRILKEIKIINDSEADAIMVENNYDIPHKIYVNPETTAVMAVLSDFVVSHTKLPVGINVLWNDYKSALGICAATGVSFIRIPAFVDDVKTKYGNVYHVADEAINYRKKLGLENKVLILADVQVKHSSMIDKKKPLKQSVIEAVKKGADAIIITGKITGDSPTFEDLEIAKKNVKGTPIFIGSGSNKKNMRDLFQFANGLIVGTAIMNKGVVNKRKINSYMNCYRKLFVS